MADTECELSAEGHRLTPAISPLSRVGPLRRQQPAPGRPLTPLPSRIHVPAPDRSASRLRFRTRALALGGPHLSVPPGPDRSSSSAASVARQRRDFLCHTAAAEAPLPVRLAGCFRLEEARVVPGWRSPSQLWHLNAGTGDPSQRDPAPGPGDLERRPGAGRGQGAVLRRQVPGSAPVRGAGRPSARRV